ncbi:hypothetical protein NESM_000143700 [Novymonas esmeraldas]|uniref:Uncharacterized protein n=1 Tax=Novymonas esmeraldas TaxID=1808958 RepID=A0AAW0F2S7_9TRYP
MSASPPSAGASPASGADAARSTPPTDALPQPAASAAPSNTAAPARRTRLLKDVEAEENRYLYETLYKSLDDTTDTAIREELTVGDTVRLAREAKVEFIKAATMPIGEKAKNCSALLRHFSERQNAQVVYVFIVFSVLMMTMPLVVLLIGMKLIAPWLGADPTTCGGGLAVLTAVILMMAYVAYAIVEDTRRGTADAPVTDSKKRQ